LILRQSFAPEAGVTTLGGFVMARLGRLPREGDHIQESGYDFLIVKMKRRRVDKVTISKVDAS
jgi:putative hemolysin